MFIWYQIFLCHSFFDLPGAIFATTFRHPIDRWYSQYRFEHLEHRDGSQPGSPRAPMLQWYNNQKGWTMGQNYYVTTFLGDKKRSIILKAKITVNYVLLLYYYFLAIIQLFIQYINVCKFIGFAFLKSP